MSDLDVQIPDVRITVIVGANACGKSTVLRGLGRLLSELAQQTDLLLLDEPTTYLDIHHQIELLDLLTDLNRDVGRTIVMVLHDLNLACRYADHIIAMKNGAIVVEGSPSRCQVVADPVSGTPLVVPRGRHHG